MVHLFKAKIQNRDIGISAIKYRIILETFEIIHYDNRQYNEEKHSRR